MGVGGPEAEGCRGTPGVGGAGHARVNVRPAPAALTQFSPETRGVEGAGTPEHPTPGRKRRSEQRGTPGPEPPAGPAPPHSPAQVTRAEESQEEAGAGSGACLALCSAPVRVSGYVSSLAVRPAAGSPKCAWEDRAHLPFFTPGVFVLLGPPLHFLPAGPPPWKSLG